MDKGWIKNSNNERVYMYLPTPKGLDNKARIAVRFLNRKLAEYDERKEEIKRLQSEMGLQIERIDIV